MSQAVLKRNPAKTVRALSKRAAIRKMVATGSVFDNRALYQYLDANPGTTKELIAQWYRLEPAKLVQSVTEAIGEKFLSVLVNPRIGNHLDEFLDFAKSYLANKGNSVSSHRLRMAYAKQLGTRVVYRGVGLENDSAAEAIGSRTGFRSFGMQQKGIEAYLRNLLDTDGAADFFGQLESKRVGKKVPAPTYMQSVSDFPSLAAAVGYRYSDFQGQPVYLFKMKISEIDLVDQTGRYCNVRFKHEKFFVFECGSKIRVTDPGVERMVYFVDVAPEAILHWKAAGTPKFRLR